MEQLIAYAALFCLEYDYDPDTLEMVLRIYQNNAIEEMHPTGDDVSYMMEKIVFGEGIASDIDSERDYEV
jgi:hypothetical protein